MLNKVNKPVGHYIIHFLFKSLFSNKTLLIKLFYIYLTYLKVCQSFKNYLELA